MKGLNLNPLSPAHNRCCEEGCPQPVLNQNETNRCYYHEKIYQGLFSPPASHNPGRRESLWGERFWVSGGNR